MLNSHKFAAEILEINADDKTPIALYANLRQRFAETLLLECLEADAPETARSYLCADPMLRFSIQNNIAVIEENGRRQSEIKIENPAQTIALFAEFQNKIKISGDAKNLDGLFGYVGYSAIPALENIEFAKIAVADEKIPDLQFALYRYVFRFDHFRHSLTALKLNDGDDSPALTDLLNQITNRRAPAFPFERIGEETTNASDADFQATIGVCREHILRGDVYQIVPSRKFSQAYRGDEFEVYRALRRVNPSPFLFFFDYGAFSLFGSSPEAQLIIQNGTATMHPIAGTYPRGATKTADSALAEKLQTDEKEVAEHVMLVDLARNDLNRNCQNVRVESFKQIEFFSHVIHLVSKVCGELSENANAFQIFADTFPAGTLSGAPKYRAMQILNEIEAAPRTFYGGAVGFFGLNGDCTTAIMIRSFLAKRRRLFFQAGAGIVFDSIAETETAEVRNKLAALRRAIELAEQEK